MQGEVWSLYITMIVKILWQVAVNISTMPIANHSDKMANITKA